MRLKLSVLALALSTVCNLVPLTAFAQDPAPPVPETPADPSAQPPPPPPPPPPAPMDPVPPPPPVDVPPPAAASDSGVPAGGPALKWEGLVDSYYLHKFTGDSTVEDPTFRAFDTLSNTFTLAYAKLALQMDADPVGLRVDFGYGQVGAIINNVSRAGSDAAPVANGAALYSSAFIVQQAYATAEFGMVTFDAGKFNTTAGAEVTESNKNWLYSRSFLFNAIPALHTGLRLTIKPTDIFTVQAAIVNGGITNNDPDNNAFKTFGVSLGIAPTPSTSLALTSYIGKEGPQGNQGQTQVLIDLVVSQALGDAFALNLNFDYYKASGDDDPYWFGFALMGKATVAEMLYFALRGELVSSKNGGYPGTDPTDTTALYEGTLMAGVPVGSNYELRLEARGDFSDKELFFNGMEMKKNQFTGLAAFIASF
jgi:hypothetical protein